MSPIEELIGGYSSYQKQLHLNSYKMAVVKRFEKGYISYEKAIRLEVKVNEWLRILRSRV